MNKEYLQKVVFLDRDGVINKCAKEHEYIREWDKFIFLPKVETAIKILNSHGYHCILITNQRGVGRGIMTMEQVNQIHNNMKQYLSSHSGKIKDIFICPHNEPCDCRKPNIGLFLQAEKKYDFDKKKVYMIGDQQTDIIAGKRYGIHTIFISKTRQELQEQPDFSCKDLYEAVKILIEKERK